MIFTGPQIIKKLIYYKEISFIRIYSFKCCHHIFKCTLVIGCCRHLGKFKRNTDFLEMIRNRITNNIMQIHRGCAYFKAAYLKSACNGSCFSPELIMMQVIKIRGIFRNRRNNRQKVRFTCSIVTNNQNTFVIARLIILKVRNCNIRNAFCHLFGNHVSMHEIVSYISLIRISKLDDCLNWIKLY